MFIRFSITKRVFAWHMIAVPALVLIIVMGAYQLIAGDIERAADEGLTQRAEAIESLILPGELSQEGIPRSILEDHTALRAFLQVIIRNENLPAVVSFVRISASDGTEIIRQGVVPSPAYRQIRALLPPETEAPQWPSIETIPVNGSTSVRVHTEPILSSDGQTMMYLQVADAVNVTTGRLLALMLLASALGSIVIIGVSTFIISTGLHPLRRIIRHIENVEASGLSSRIPDSPRPPELEVLAKNLNHMWERLESAFNVRAAFVAAVSHDMRTPLTILQGQLDLLSVSGTLAQDDRERLLTIQREVRHLVRLTNNVLLYTQLDSETAQQTFMPVDVAELASDVAQDMRSYASGRTIEFYGAFSDVHVMGDYDLLKTAFVNVIENATKYTRSNGRIVVAVDDSGPTCTVSISDNGIGIQPDDLPHVTEPYYRGKNGPHPSRGGTGLGLTLVDRIVRLHHGQMWIDSSPGKGTNVTMELTKASVESLGMRYDLAGAFPPQRSASK